MADFIDVCRFTPTLGGTTDWTYSAAVVGYQSPTAAGAVNGAVYRYRAESADLLQWEIGFGAYSSGTGTFARTTVLFNSAGTTAKVNFSTVPQVAIVALAEDLYGKANLAGGNTFTGQQFFNATGVSGISPVQVYTDDGGVSAAGFGAIVYAGAGGGGYLGGFLHGGGARGTRAAPTKLLAGDIYSGFGGLPAYDNGSGVGVFGTSSPVSIHYILHGDANGVNDTPAYIQIYATAVGSGAASRVPYWAGTQDGTWFAHDAAAYNPRSTDQTKPTTGLKVLASGTSSTSVQNAIGVAAYGVIPNGFRGMGAGGTAATPTKTTSGQQLVTLLGYGWNAATGTWSASSTVGIIMTAAEDYTTNQGAGMTLETTSIGSTSRAAAVKIHPSGGVSIGATAIATDPGIGNLSVSSALQVGSFTVATLPSGVTGRTVFCSNCRVFNGAGTQEGAAAGTGGYVTFNGTAWKIAGTNVTAIA